MFSTKDSLKRHSLPKDWKKESTKKRQFLYEKLSEEKSMLHKFSQKSPPKKYSKKHFHRKLPEEKALQTYFQKKTLKHIEREIAAKKYVKIKFCPNMSVEKCATKETLNRNLFQASSKRNRKVV